MKTAAFAPKRMKLSILTAALQELTPREKRDADPDLAIEDWLEFSRDIGCPFIQLSSALHPSAIDVPAEAMLDPVANTLDLRQPFDAHRASRILKAMATTRVGLSDVAYFDNMLAADRTARGTKHAFMRRVFDAAVLLGTDAVCGFVGRNPDLEFDENIELFEAEFIPLLKEAKARGLTYRVEQCPMPVMDARGLAGWGYGGQTLQRGDWAGGRPSTNPADQVHAWKKQTAISQHELPGTARHDPLAYLQNRTVDWLDHQLAAREVLGIDAAHTYLVVEHEYPPARVQDRQMLKPILQGSLAFVEAIDAAAAAMYALQHEVLVSQGIAIQGIGREAYRS